ncbi:MAG: zinc/iron-chelating domain-containing protein [Burkholderiales bacterium PBB2]|nr:MAG: zinc/iron-chelating domain-containing protein [Burkholderiales bacterium PBB2]
MSQVFSSSLTSSNVASTPTPVELESSQGPSPCQACGACCASFRVSFYWAEAADLASRWVEPLTPHLSCMAGTNRKSPRCEALAGELGREVACGIYAQRPSPCREVQAGDDKCQRARAAHGLPPWSGCGASA